MVVLKKIKVVGIIIMVITIGLFHNPVHDLNLLIMRLHFINVEKIQPIETHFIWRKSYIGSQGSSGNWRCNYMIGELRSFNNSKEKVMEQYQKLLDGNDNMAILFMDGDKWPLDSILWDWRGEFLDQHNIESGKYYIIFISKKFPALFDTRCKA